MRQSSIWYSTITTKDGLVYEQGPDHLVMIHRIVRIAKNQDNGYSVIHLDTGEKITSYDSLSLLKSKIDVAGQAE